MIPREALAKALGGDKRVVSYFEEQDRKVTTVTNQIGNVPSSDVLAAASVITLSPNAEFQGEFVLSVGRGIGANVDTGTIELFFSLPLYIDGGYDATFLTNGTTSLVLPTNGELLAANDVVTAATSAQTHLVPVMIDGVQYNLHASV